MAEYYWSEESFPIYWPFLDIHKMGTERRALGLRPTNSKLKRYEAWTEPQLNLRSSGAYCVDFFQKRSLNMVSGTLIFINWKIE
jgi:hypothetical protein